MATCSRLDELRTAHRTSIWNKKNARDESSKRQSVCFSLRKSLESLRKQETELTRLRCELVNQELDALLKTDWRYLQGIDWEQFLFRIFHEHGYKVEGTKIVGDQGVDLIVKSHGKVLAVQAKGYAGSVGNSAVQEVVTGKLHYGATHCAVICNSAFTKSAEQLSRTTGCIMIDGAGIPNLIKNGMAILNSN